MRPGLDWRLANVALAWGAGLVTAGVSSPPLHALFDGGTVRDAVATLRHAPVQIVLASTLGLMLTAPLAAVALGVATWAGRAPGDRPLAWAVAAATAGLAVWIILYEVLMGARAPGWTPSAAIREGLTNGVAAMVWISTFVAGLVYGSRLRRWGRRDADPGRDPSRS